MDRRIVSALLVTLILSSGLYVYANAATLTVDTEKDYYVPGEMVRILGTVDAGSSKNVTVRVNDTLGLVNSVTVLSNASTGKYSTQFMLSASALLGKYVVNATTPGASAKTTFEVVMAYVKSLAERLVSEAIRARARVEAVLEEFDLRNITVPTVANDTYRQGVQLEEQAARLLATGNYTEAVNWALQSLQKFNAALRLLRAVEPEEDFEDEEEEGLIGPRVAIQRAYRFLDKLNATARNLSEEGLNVSDIRANLNEAKEHLDNATELLNSGDVSGAAHELAAARGILGRTNAMLHQLAKGLKISRTEKFLDRCQDRINGMMEWLRKKGFGLTSVEISSLTSTLGRAGMKLGMIRSRLSKYDIDEELGKLSKALEDLAGFGNLSKREVMNLFKELERAEARVSALGASIEKLARKGFNTTGIENELQNAEAMVAQIRLQLQTGNTDPARSLIEDVDNRLDRIDNMLMNSRSHGRGKGKGNG